MEAYNNWFKEFQQALQDDKYDILMSLVLNANSVNKAIPKEDVPSSFIAWDDTYNLLLQLYQAITRSMPINPYKDELQSRILKWNELSTTSPSRLFPVSYPSTPSIGVPTESSHPELANSVGVAETASQAASIWGGAESFGHHDNMVPFVGHRTVVIPPYSSDLVPSTKKVKYPIGPPADHPCDSCIGKSICFTVAKPGVKMCHECATNSKRCSRAKRNQNSEPDFSVIDALRGLQAAQKSHVEFTSRQALLSEERHTNLLQELREATGKVTLLAEKLDTVVNVVLQPQGGLTDQNINNAYFPYIGNPPDPSFVEMR